MDPGSASPPAEDVILPLTVDTTRSSTFPRASRCVAPPAEEPFATVCGLTASTATMDEPADAKKCLDEDNYVLNLYCIYDICIYIYICKRKEEFEGLR